MEFILDIGRSNVLASQQLVFMWQKEERGARPVDNVNTRQKWSREIIQKNKTSISGESFSSGQVEGNSTHKKRLKEKLKVIFLEDCKV